MKIKLLSLAALFVAALGVSGCYDVYPGAYGYRGGPGPVYAGGYYPAGGWGDWGGWGYPVYHGHDSWHHDRDWDHDHWDHGGWGHDHFVVPEHRGFVAHNFGAPMGHGFAVAHNDGFHDGRFHGGGGAGGRRGGGGYHGRGSHGAER